MQRWIQYYKIQSLTNLFHLSEIMLNLYRLNFLIHKVCICIFLYLVVQCNNGNNFSDRYAVE